MIVESFPTRIGDGAALGMGTTFPIALGSFRSASLLIANVSGGDVAIDVYKGTRDAIGNGIFSNPRIINNAIWKVSLTQNEALSNLIVTATGFVVVEVVIDDSRTIQSFMVLPRQ